MKYTAIISRNFRDIHTMSPKVLLRNIQTTDNTVFRDHCWVDINDNIKRILPRGGNNSAYLIRFKAEPKNYCNSKTNQHDKISLDKLTNIVVLKKLRKTK